MSQYATKMEETDQWFEDKTFVIENLDSQLRKLLIATEAMVEYRKCGEQIFVRNVWEGEL